MKDVFLLYDTSCFFEIVILNYFMSLTGCGIVYCSLDGQPIRATEGYSVNVDMALKDVDPQQIRSFIVPGGDISAINTEEVNDGRVITARANAYVDFAIETAKELELFEDEADLQETIDFWKYHKRAE